MVLSLGKIRLPASSHANFSRSFSVSRASNLALAISVNLEEAAVFSDFNDSNESDITTQSVKHVRTPTLKQNLLFSRSQQLESSLLVSSDVKLQQTSKLSEQVKKKIIGMIEQNNYDTLVATLSSWVLASLSVRWNSVLTHNELSYIIGLLVEYQGKLLTKAASMKLLEKKSDAYLCAFKHVHQTKDLIRAIFANLLNAEDHLYRKKQKGAEFQLSAKDYENIITLELNNAKLDLASLWFKHMETSYPDGQHYKLMTKELWLLKFKVYGGSHSPLWTVQKPELYERNIKPRQSVLKSEVPWMQICEEYSKNQALLLGSSRIVFDNSLVCSMINSVAYSKNIRQVYGLIQLNWGIQPNGKMDPGFLIPSKDDPLYPDLNVLTTVVLALIFNEEFRSALSFINGFQDNYHIELLESKFFWDQIFRWSDLKTRFNEYRALNVFLNDTKCTAVPAPANASQLPAALLHAQKSPNFDYRGYLEFVSRLRDKRQGLIQELWKCYHESSPGFSIRPYQTYYSIIEETPVDDQCYELLEALAREWHIYGVSKHSYNKGASKYTSKKIEQLYRKTIKRLLDLKGETGVSIEQEPIIQKWSLDDKMSQELRQWLAGREEYYVRVLRMKEMRKFLEEQEERKLDDQEKLLDLFE